MTQITRICHVSMAHRIIFTQFSSVQLLTSVHLFGTPRPAARQASLSITNSRSFLKLMSIESVKTSNHLILCHLLLLLPSIFPSIRVFSNVSASVLLMNIQDWFPLGLPAVQGTLKSLLRGGLQSTGLQKVGHNWATNTLCSHQRGPVQQEDSGCPQGGTPSVEIVGSKALSSAFQIQKLSLLVKL